MVKNKHGWVRIVEAFIAVMLIAGVVIVVLSQGYAGEKDVAPEVYDVEILILREIQLDNGLREEILVLDITNPVSSEDATFPAIVKSRIDARLPDYLECVEKICEMDKICAMDYYIEKEVYAQAIGITATLQTYNPRQLKLFCWMK